MVKVFESMTLASAADFYPIPLTFLEFYQLFVPSICLLLFDQLCQYNKAAHTSFAGFQK